jgi:hypothetical protein
MLTIPVLLVCWYVHDVCTAYNKNSKTENLKELLTPRVYL